jgi:ABC-2 type transport system ATP-binding protein
MAKSTPKGMAASAIHTRELTKSYGNKMAVSSLDLTVKEGEVFGFLGPNGAGKTTTMKMLVGLIRQTSGKIEVLGARPTLEDPGFKRKIGYLPETVQLYEKLSGREHLDFVARLYQIPQKTRAERIGDLVSMFELDDCANRLIETYSKGQKQKLALAQTLIHDPELLLLDEPTSGLDPKASRLIKEILLDLKKDGTTIFLSTHLLDIVENLCQTVGVIYQGKMVACDDVKVLGKDSSALEERFIELTGGLNKEDIHRWRRRTRL